ncbi:MAG: diacylglycerol/polyprenol kinase family protein [Candidatus Thorarchaeota archaeon]
MDMDYWTAVGEMYNVTLSLAFFVLAFLMFYIGRKGYKLNNQYGGVSSTLTGICFIIFGYYNSIVRFFPYPYNGFMVWWIGIVLLTNLIFSFMIKREIKKMGLNNELNTRLEGKKPALRRYIERMTKENPYREEITLKMEYVRKSFHLTGLLLILAFFGLPFLYPVTRIISDGVIELINNLGPVYTNLWGNLSLFPFTIGDPLSVVYLTMMALIGALMFALISDLIRIIWGPEYSVFNFLTRSMLREKERNAAGPQIYIITGFVFSYMLFMVNLVHIFAVFSGILIACLSDAAAAIIGRKYGKHKVMVRNKDKKSVEGFLAGTIVAYLIGLIFVGPIYAIIGALIFLITDYFPIFTADNLLNPIFIPIGIQLFILILGLPVGW